MPGNAAPTKTPTASCANISPSARAWPTSPNTIALGSRRNSTAGRGSGWAFGLRRNAMRDETQCCTSKLISNRAPHSSLCASFENLPQGVIDSHRVLELCSDIGIQHDDVCAFAEALHVLPPYALTEV